MSIRSSVGSGGVNQFADVKLVQQLLNGQKVPAYTYGPIAVDGLIGPQTIGAITHYQKVVVRLPLPDGRVDPGGPTIATLERNANGSPSPAPPPPPRGARVFTLTFRHGGSRPPFSGAGMYESTITLVGPKSGTFRGSIYPDYMNEKGRIKDGTYDLSLTFHHKKGVPTARDLVVKTDGDLRPALTVNDCGSVPVISDNPAKTTSAGINVHNGFSSRRWSDGCLTLQPSDWSRFIQIFLDLYPNLDDWYGNGSWRGAKVGSLKVQA
jgi:hypothetical protein